MSRWGDVYRGNIEDLDLLLKDANKYKLQLHHLHFRSSDEFLFVCMHWEFKKVAQYFPYVQYQYSIGIFHFIRLYLTKKYRIIGLLSFFLGYIFLAQLSFGYQIDNTYPQITKDIQSLCEQYQLNQVRFIYDELSIKKIENEIKNILNEDVDYFDIYLNGHIYQIDYTKKINSQLKEIDYTSLVASQDAVVDKIDIVSGNVLVKKGQYVSKNQLLVSNEILDTSQNISFVSVEGKIYGYVYHTFEAHMKGDLNPDTYFYLYQQIIKQVKSQIGDEGKIINENVLQYDKKEGKIVLRIQFTLYQNIAKKEFLNEE